MGAEMIEKVFATASGMLFAREGAGLDTVPRNCLRLRQRRIAWQGPGIPAGGRRAMKGRTR